MTEQTDLRELREKIERADQMVTNLCKPRYTPNAREWTMSIPARPDHDPDLVIGAGLDAGRAALERLEKLEADNKRLRRGLENALIHTARLPHAPRDLLEGLLASVTRICKAALSMDAASTPAPEPQQGGEQ